MPTFGRYTHAIISRVPDSFQSLPTIDGTCIDLDKVSSFVMPLKGIVAWNAYQNDDFNHEIQKYHQTNIILYYNK